MRKNGTTTTPELPAPATLSDAGQFTAQYRALPDGNLVWRCGCKTTATGEPLRQCPTHWKACPATTDVEMLAALHRSYSVVVRAIDTGKVYDAGSLAKAYKEGAAHVLAQLKRQGIDSRST